MPHNTLGHLHGELASSLMQEPSGSNRECSNDYMGCVLTIVGLSSFVVLQTLEQLNLRSFK